MDRLWRFPDIDAEPDDLDGLTVEAIDGEIGKVDAATTETDASYIVVDTEPWMLDDRVVLPAGTIRSVDVEGGTIAVSVTREQVKASPLYDPDTDRDTDYRAVLTDYYGGLDRAPGAFHSSGDVVPSSPKAQRTLIDGSEEGSFPASDPPSYWGREVAEPADP